MNKKYSSTAIAPCRPAPSRPAGMHPLPRRNDGRTGHGITSGDCPLRREYIQSVDLLLGEMVDELMPADMTLEKNEGLLYEEVLLRFNSGNRGMDHWPSALGTGKPETKSNEVHSTSKS